MRNMISKLGITILVLGMVSFGLMSFTGFQKPWDTPEKYKSMKNPTKPTDENIAIGKALYVKHCKACHGSTGKGDGPKAVNLKTKMRSLTSPEVRALSPGEMYYRSFIGRDEMPNFESKIPEINDRWYIINYLATLK